MQDRTPNMAGKISLAYMRGEIEPRSARTESPEPDTLALDE